LRCNIFYFGTSTLAAIFLPSAAQRRLQPEFLVVRSIFHNGMVIPFLDD